MFVVWVWKALFGFGIEVFWYATKRPMTARTKSPSPATRPHFSSQSMRPLKPRGAFLAVFPRPPAGAFVAEERRLPEGVGEVTGVEVTGPTPMRSDPRARPHTTSAPVGAT